jgi:hypothetical protein
MPALLDLTYATAGGVIGAAVTNYLSRNQERRQLRAMVMQEIHRVAARRDGVCDIASRRRGRPAQYFVGTRLPVTERFGITAVVGDDGDAEAALREALSQLVVAGLSAGIPRRILDFAAGGEVRALCQVLRLIDLRLGGVLGEALEELVAQCEQYRRATDQLLIRSLWHPWQTRCRMPTRTRRLRQHAAELQHRQEAAMAVLIQPEHTDALIQRIGPA